MHTNEAAPPTTNDLLDRVSRLGSAWVIRYNLLRLRMPIAQAARQTIREHDDAASEDLRATVIVCGGVS